MAANATLYRWEDLTTDAPMPLLGRQRIIGEKTMISRVTLHKGCKVPTHSHANEQISCIVSGRLKFEVGDEARTVIAGPGDAPPTTELWD